MTVSNDNLVETTAQPLMRQHIAREHWLTTSGNEPVIHECLKLLLNDDDPRLILIEGEGGSGLTSVLYELERRLSRAKDRSLSLYEDSEADARYIFANIAQMLKMPKMIREIATKKMPCVYENVLFTRSYRFIFIHDAGRFLMFSKVVTRGNYESLVYLLAQPMRPKVVIGGSHDAVSKYSQMLEEYTQVRFVLEPMVNDSRYAAFVDSLAKQYNLHQKEVSVNANAIHILTGGCVGATGVEVLLVCHASV